MGPFWLQRCPDVTARAVLASPLVCVSCIFIHTVEKGQGFLLEKQLVLMAFMIWWLIYRT